jgi:hypothetical protein
MLTKLTNRVRHDNGGYDPATYRCKCGGTVYMHSVWGNTCDNDRCTLEFNMSGQELVKNWRDLPDDGSDLPDY